MAQTNKSQDAELASLSPAAMVSKIQKLSFGDGVLFARELAQVTGSNLSKYNPLKLLNLDHGHKCQYWIDVLKHAARTTNPDTRLIAEIYMGLYDSCQTAEQIALVRRTFDEDYLWIPNDKEPTLWRNRKTCVWDGPAKFHPRLQARLASIVEYKGLEPFFTKVLEITDAQLVHLLDSLANTVEAIELHIKIETAIAGLSHATDKIRAISTELSFDTVKQEITAWREVLEAHVENVYDELASSIHDDRGKEIIRTRFAAGKLVYSAKHKSCVSLTSCVWNSDVTDEEGKIRLSEEYPALKELFVDILGLAQQSAAPTENLTPPSSQSDAGKDHDAAVPTNQATKQVTPVKQKLNHSEYYFKMFLQYHADLAARISGLPASPGSVMDTSALLKFFQKTTPTTDNALDLLFKDIRDQEKRERTGTLGELFVFKLLEGLKLPQFSTACWQSRLRDQARLLNEYISLESMSEHECADIVYLDRSNKLIDHLVKQKYLDPSKYKFTSPTVYIEVKTSVCGSDRDFFLSAAQLRAMQRMQLKPAPAVSTELYIIARVFNLGSSKTSFELHVDPQRLITKTQWQDEGSETSDCDADNARHRFSTPQSRKRARILAYDSD